MYKTDREITFQTDHRLVNDYKKICASMGVSPSTQLQGLVMQFVANHADKLFVDEGGPA
jgi:antitoxin component of RelBE/YafQ-DinJ toxin-antitoxin module